MRLKVVELYGFKSFAQKTVLRFEDDFVAIVGPNGSGKSNFSDAVRWVLGEQSAKALRGSKMEDIIFSGTDQKKAMNMAEVSLTFDNTDGALALPYDEVVVSRKMYRNGESEYAINRQVVRRKDVYELFFDTGIGKEGYSLIGQGRIDEILRAKGEDRRAVFEEAAGISKFKFKKTEATRRLAKTEDQLGALELEMKAQDAELKVLKQQAENAQQGMALLKTLEQHELSFLKAGVDHDDEERQKLSAEAEKWRGERETWQAKKEQAEAALAPLEGFMETDAAQEREAESRIAQWERQMAQEQMAESAAEEKKQFYTETLQHLSQQDEKDHTREGITRENLALAQAEAENAEKALAALQESEEPEEEEVDDEAFSRASLRLKEAQDALTVLGVREEQQKERHADETTRLAEQKKRLEEAVSQRDALQTAQAERSAQWEALEQRIAVLVEQQQRLEDELRDLSAKDEQTRLHRTKAVEERAGVVSRGRVLLSLREQYEGYQRAVQMLMNYAKQNDDVKTHLIGPLGELVTVKKGFETAVEVALGGAMQNIVVPHEGDAKALIALLKQKRWGRVTFLPLDRIRGQHPVKLGRPQELCQGLEALEYDEALDPILTHFLARTSFVRTIDDALALSHQTNQNRLVTLEGEVINTWGSMVGGTHRRAEGSIFTRENELLDAQEKAKALAQRIREDDELLALSAKERERLSGISTDLSQQREELHAQKVALSEAMAVASVQIDEQAREIERLEALLASDGVETVDFTALKREAQEALDAAMAAYQSLADARNEAMKRKAIYEEERRHREAERAQAEQTKHALTARKQQLEAQYEDLVRQREERARQMDEAQTIIEANAARIQEAQKRRMAIAAQCEEAQAQLTRLREINREKRNEVERRSAERKEAADALQDIDSRLTKISWNVEHVEMRRRERFENYAGQYDLSREMVEDRLSRLEPVATTQKIINGIKQQLSQIGYFNVDTIDQYRERAEERRFLQAQMDDLAKSKADIEELIRELDQTMVLQFRETFDQINASYDRIFRILFRGGQAALRLDGDDVLSAGIEIEAQPPGKKRQNLDLLSGGERSMTALALLFALFSIRPTPFCILDEIDASLDEANIGRYVEYLNTLRDQTQFIVITHRKTTMELAETLYGVTMQEGISQVVYLRFTDVEGEKRPVQTQEV